MHRYVTEKAIELIKLFEGFSPRPYICPAGWRTIGWGHVILPEEKFTIISPEEAEELLRKDLLHAENAVLRLIKVPLSDGAFDALVSFTFNLGAAALQRSTLRMKLNRGEPKEEVAAEFLRWVYAGGRRLKGLVRRRVAEMALFLS